MAAPPPDPDPARRLAVQLLDLVDKYRLLEALHAGEPGRTIARRDAIRAVADRFPAAMREWDELPAEEITRRRAAVEALAADPAGALARLAAPELAWVRYAADLHERLRAALRVKRWLAGRAVTDELAGEAARRFGLDRASLAAVAAPHNGRFTDQIYRDIAEIHHVTVAELKRALFGDRAG
jgi:hypothetical protein